MKVSAKLWSRRLSAFAFFVPSLLFVSGCEQKNESSSVENTSKYQFVFEGSSSEFANNNNFHLKIYGNKDDDCSFQMLVDEMPAVKLPGKWVYVENKGYKLYFNDVNKSYVYTRYDVQAKEFSFKFNVDLGGGYGIAKVRFVSQDTEFAKVYDGEGLDPLPPTFRGVGAGMTENYTLNYWLVCYEDGTCASFDDFLGLDRNGEWTYDKQVNQYSFHFGPDTYYDMFIEDGKYKCVLDYKQAIYYDEPQDFNDFKTIYDEATKTFTLKYEATCGVYGWRTATYTVDE